MQTPLFAKAFIVLMLLAIIASLGVALWRLVRDRGESKATVKALTVRIGMSLALFALLVLGVLSGVIVPHGVVP